ncbi:MAG: signal peptidase I [Gammaproteobacteria bacterium]
MVWDFLSILTLVVIAMGCFILFDNYYQRRYKTILPSIKQEGIVHYSLYKKIQNNVRQFFPMLLIVLVIRAFIAQPFRVPTGSLEPTVLPGDMIIVTQFNYGLRSPIFLHKLLPLGEPKRGDIAVFHWPSDIQYHFVKRVIGLPGDHIEYHNKVLTVNGQEWEQKDKGEGEAYDEPGSPHHTVIVREEQLPQGSHKVFIDPNILGSDFDVTVPKNNYFVMGDNRDHSDDSRYWGFLPEKDLVGKANFVLLSWDNETWRIRWSRTGKVL